MPINFIAVVVAAVAAWFVGAIWYGALGEQWLAALDRMPEGLKQGSKKIPVGPMIVSFVAELLMAFVMAGLILHFTTVSIKTGAIVGALCWLGFVAPAIVTNNAYPGRKPLLSAIDCGHWLAVLLVEGVVIGAFG